MKIFDEIIERRHTNCYKWDSLIEKYGEDNDIIPMGVADMAPHSLVAMDNVVWISTL